MYSMILISFDSLHYTQKSSESRSRKALLDIHHMIINKFVGLKINPNNATDHPQLKRKFPFVQRTTMKKMVHYFEFLKTVSDPTEWISLSKPDQFSEFVIPTFTNVQSHYSLMEIERNFTVILKEELQKMTLSVPPDLSNASTTLNMTTDIVSSPFDYQIHPLHFALPNGLNSFMPIDVMISRNTSSADNSSGTIQNEEKALIEIYEFDDDKTMSGGEQFSRSELLKIYFYSHYYPQIPFFRLRLSDIQERPQEIASLLLKQIRD
jgi:hypothetical protein